MVHPGDGDVIAVHPGVLDDVIPGDGALQVVLKELLHIPGVRAGSAEKGRSLEGPAAGAHGELLGVQHDAGQQGLRLGAEEVGGLHDILQKLGDQLAGGGGVGLVEVEGRVGDIGGRPAVVVDDRHLVAGEEQLLRRDLLGPVGVHHHQQAVGVGQDQRVLGGDEGLLVLRESGELLHHAAGRVLAGLPDDVGGNPPLPADRHHPRRRADTI